MKNLNNTSDILIFGSHQLNIKAHSGGYIRLREFLKRIPDTLNFKIIDNSPTIYSDIVNQSSLIKYNLPSIVQSFINKFFTLGTFIERIYTGLMLYRLGTKIIHTNKTKLLYVPIGEFLHLYLPAILLKRKFKNLLLVVDILNLEILDKKFIQYFRRLRKNNIGLIHTIITFPIHYLTFFIICKTIRNINYIFSVSPELVDTIKTIYKKDTIDFTLSGVNNNFLSASTTKKNYLGVYLGRITKHKGVFDLLHVWHEVVKVKPRAQLAIIGFVNNDVLCLIKNTIHSLRLEKNVVVFGAVSEEKKHQILSESELFIHLAQYEPLFPVIGILEGFSCGLPAVIFNMPVVASQKDIQTEPCVYVIKNGDLKSATRQTLDFASLSSTEKQILSQRAKKFAGRYDWNVIAKKEFSIISKLLNY